MMTRILRTLIGIFILVSLHGCDRDTMSERGFSLPEGDPLAGEQAFLAMQCNECHSINSLELPTAAMPDSPYVELGGEVSKVKTYGDLVTSIINPSHKLAPGYPLDDISEDGKSKMVVYNEYMTVQELIDIVMFLQPHYKIVPPIHNYPVFR